MTIMIDECTQRGARLTSDAGDDGAELHKFAAKIGIKRSWFSDSETFPHYVLTPFFRGKAHAAGARFVAAEVQKKARDDRAARIRKESEHVSEGGEQNAAAGREPVSSEIKTSPRIGDE